MIAPKQFIDWLSNLGIDFFTGVPDSLLKDLCAFITENCPEKNHVIAANEGGAIALASGYHLATGKIGMVYMQNSGTGNAINPLLSLADTDVYSIPMLVTIGWRGEPGIHDEPQHKKQGRVQEQLLKALGYRYEILSNDPDIAKPQLISLVNEMKNTSAPVILLVRKGTFSEFVMALEKKELYEMTREEAIGIILNMLNSQDRIVSTTGMASREIYELRDKNKNVHENDFLTVGSMGHAIMIATGIALFQSHTIYCIDGDGAIIMHMGSLGIAAKLKSKNFKHIVINNGAHDSVGGQPTIGYQLELYKVAKELGYSSVYRADNAEELKCALNKLHLADGPSFLEVRVRGGARKELGRPKTSPLENKKIFMENL